MSNGVTSSLFEWPRVTWLLPVLNGMPYLAELLESLAAQTYPNHEIVVWDNGSTDDSIKILRAWIPSRIDGRIITGQPLPLGIARARLTELAETELCAAIDADDVHLPTRLTTEVSAMIAEPSIVAMGCIPEIIDSTGNRLPDWEYPLTDPEIRWRTRWQSCLNAPSVLVKRSAVLQAGNYRNFKPGQDLDLWMRLAQIGPMKNLADRLVRYRRHNSSVTGLVTDHFHDERNIAVANTDVIFPGFDAAMSIDLWDASYPHHERHAVRLQHFKRLRDAAENAALAIGAPKDFFTNTNYYRRQRWTMLKNLLYPYAPEFVWSAVREVRKRAS